MRIRTYIITPLNHQGLNGDSNNQSLRRDENLPHWKSRIVLLHSQEEVGYNPSNLGTPEATAEMLDVTLKKRGDTYILPEILYILEPSGCESHPRLRTSKVAIFRKTKVDIKNTERYDSQSNTGQN